MYKGIFHLGHWSTVILIVAGMLLTNATISLYLHRQKTHLAVTFHPVVNNFFRLWLWLSTLGVLVPEWVAVHRKHHAKCDTVDDPHSPKILGVRKMLTQGVIVYRQAIKDVAMVNMYSKGVQSEWIGRRLCDNHKMWGAPVFLAGLIVLFGFGQGTLIWFTQLLTMPFFSSAFIIVVFHSIGYRNPEAKDTSTNFLPIGLLFWGEELHSNHHVRASSAKLSTRWWEVDTGWGVIKTLAFFRLARVNRA